jgi:hypothetical protein
VEHELAHALLARRFGVRVKDITLWALGGMTAFEEEPPTPRAAALVAVAGPVVSLLLGGVFVVGAFSVDPSWLGGLPAVALNWLAVMNILLGLFNLVPAAPLDGGRVLRAWLWSRIGDRDKATARAATVGQAFGFGLVVLGVVTLMSGYLGGLWLARDGPAALAAPGRCRSAGSTLARRGRRTAHRRAPPYQSAPRHCRGHRRTRCAGWGSHPHRHRTNYGLVPPWRHACDRLGPVAGMTRT